MTKSSELFFESINLLMQQVCSDPRVESAWLTALAHMEDLAAKQILGNVNSTTPVEFYEEIKIHAADEARHRDALLAIRPFPEAVTAQEKELRETLKGLGESFTLGYFGNPILVEAKSRFNAYVHGALTIEQFPFQLYSAYIKTTSSLLIRDVLNDVLADEGDHIQLGKKMLCTLPAHERLPLKQLQTIEKEMCHKMVLRMSEVAMAYREGGQPRQTGAMASERLVQRLAADPVSTTFWIHSLGNAEKVAASHMQRVYSRRGLQAPADMKEHVQDEERHGKLLQQTVLLKRRRLRQQEANKVLELQMLHAMEKYLLSFFSKVMKHFSDPDQIYLYGALGTEMRVFKHYSDLTKTTHAIDVAYVLDLILEDEARHTQMVNTNLRNTGHINADDLRWLRTIEEECFEKTAFQMLSLLGEQAMNSSRFENFGVREVENVL